MSDIRTTDDQPASIDYAGAVRRRWWVVVAGLVVGAVLGALAITVQHAVYESSTSVLVTDTGAPSTGDAANARTNSGINLDTEAQLVKSQVVTAKAQALLKTSTSLADLSNQVTVTVPANTQVLTITYSASSAKVAQAGSKAFADAYLANRSEQAQNQIKGQIAALQGQRTALNSELATAAGQIASLPTTSVARQQAEATRSIVGNQLSTVGNQLSTLSSIDITPGNVISQAGLPSGPTSPNRLLDMGGALLAGLLLGLIVAAILERSDKRVYTLADARRRADLQPLVNLPRKRMSVRLAEPHDENALAFSRMRNALTALLEDNAGSAGPGMPPLAVLSATTSDATCGVVVANLAATLARSGSQVTLLCADAGSSSLDILQVDRHQAGIAQIGQQGNRFSDTVQQTHIANLRVVGPGAGEPASLDRTVMAVLDGIESESSLESSVVLVEAPFVQAEVISRLAGAVILVVTLGRTRRTTLADMRPSLHPPQARFVALRRVLPVKAAKAATAASAATDETVTATAAARSAAPARPGTDASSAATAAAAKKPTSAS